MEALKSLVAKVPNDKHRFEGWFQEIANLLFCNYHIQTKNASYNITEMEFYYYNEDHKDETTYGFAKNMERLNERIQRHKKAQCKPFTWFFHYSGVDLVIGKENEPGGILIRALQNTITKEVIKGPLVVLLELLNQHADVEGNNKIHLQLVKNESVSTCNIKTKERVGIGVGELNKALYNYSII